MQIQITGKNIDITDAIKTYTNEKFQLLAHHFTSLDKVHVVYNIENLTQNAEATTHLYNTDFHAYASNNDLYVAITELVHKLEKQLASHKEKIIDSHHRK